jgi:type I restriction enzyme M protein
MAAESMQSIFKRIDNALRMDEGCSTELDYIEQSSWVLFLKYLDALESERNFQAEINQKQYSYIINEEYRWHSWATPLNSDGSKSLDKLTGSDIIIFVEKDLFSYLAGFKLRATSPDSIEYKIGIIFDQIRNRFRSGYQLRDVIDAVEDLKFGTSSQNHEMSTLYEEKIKRMGNAGRNGGEYYTPRPLIRSLIHVIDPQVGETIYDGAVGSAGFLCEAFEHLMSKDNLSANDSVKIQKSTLYGKEKKPLAFVIGIMNMILHGVDTPNITRTNTLKENIMDYQEKDRYDIVLANPPFGGSENPEVMLNFPIRNSSETAYLFLQHFIKILKSTGRAAIVIKNTFLSNTDAEPLRQELLKSCKLHTILDCPAGVFTAGVKTVVLFFEKGAPTQNIWYYQLKPVRSTKKMGKTNPLNDNDMKEFLELQKSFADSEKSWTVNVSDIDTETFDLSAKNPNVDDEVILRSPTEILDEIEKLDEESREILSKIRALL